MTTKDKIIDVETIDYVLNNMEYDWSEIEEELKEAIGLTLKFQNQKIIKEIKKRIKTTKEIIRLLEKQERPDLVKPYELVLFNEQELLKIIREKEQ